MKKTILEEKLQEILSALQTIEGVKSVDSIVGTLRNRMVFPEITYLILNSRFELLYLIERQKVVLRTVEKGITLDSACIEEINLISQHIDEIEGTLNELIEADTPKTIV